MILIILLTTIIIVYSISKLYINPYNELIIKQIKNELILFNQGYENISINIDYNQSYTINKKDIYICIGDNTLSQIMYIVLHEIAHILTSPSNDEHNDEFKSNFNMLIKQAKILNIQVDIPHFHQGECSF